MLCCLQTASLAPLVFSAFHSVGTLNSCRLGRCLVFRRNQTLAKHLASAATVVCLFGLCGAVYGLYIWRQRGSIRSNKVYCGAGKQKLPEFQSWLCSWLIFLALSEFWVLIQKKNLSTCLSFVGRHCEVHQMIGNYMWDPKTNTSFDIGVNKDSLLPLWWNGSEPLWVTMMKAKKKVSMYYWPGWYL